ncbi:MAG: YqeG family HAD IIIA-type phosphatase [Fimbriimonadaceae bacterium]|jgi:hypothetical protein|nr:YqeG family HAD IIIA-type phosphatase [Fimbriimonadaceae bacterium]
MKSFRPGTFNTEAVPATLRPFSPNEALSHLEDVDLENLWESGKRLLLLDVDNTLLPWKSREIPSETHEWIARARAIGFELCILSNTRQPERLDSLCQTMGIPYIREKFKPSRQMYLSALEKYSLTPNQAVMIGDQLLTDIWGANRSGIDAIWVRPLGSREFIGTRLVSRNIEKLIGRLLYRYFQDDTPDAERRPGFFGRKIVRQLLKFGIVGAAATLVDLGLHNFLLFHASWNGEPLRNLAGRWAIETFRKGWEVTPSHIHDAAFAPLKVGPVLLAILVSYLLNQAWTFRSKEQKPSVNQAVQFYTVALIGMVISVTVSSTVNRAATGSAEANWAVASLFGMVAGFAWNFTMQRLWTFRKAK